MTPVPCTIAATLLRQASPEDRPGQMLVRLPNGETTFLDAADVTVAVKPDYAPGDEIVMHGREVDAMGALITQEWFEHARALEGDHEVGAGFELMDLLCGPGIARPTGIISESGK
ncbi:hypothetical protein [Caulobacter sp.]|uniref:hypothetical protein n=1 Tax=Caulobacter sp. TaxID=78 RepID=UPI003BB21A6A